MCTKVYMRSTTDPASLGLVDMAFGECTLPLNSPLTLAEMRRNSARQSEIQTHYLPIPSSDKGSMANPEEIYSSSC